MKFVSESLPCSQSAAITRQYTVRNNRVNLVASAFALGVTASRVRDFNSGESSPFRYCLKVKAPHAVIRNKKFPS